MKIPVFHDDQHGTAIVAAAALLNALHVVGKRIGEVKLVCSGAGAAAIACLNIVVGLGVRRRTSGSPTARAWSIAGRTEAMDPQKAQLRAGHRRPHAGRDHRRGRRVLRPVRRRACSSRRWWHGWPTRPIILAMANPDPEIRPELAKEVRPDCIIATGRSDYPNQVNNVLCFPFIFRGALDVGATTINEEMKLACVRAIAELARADVSDVVAAAYGRQDIKLRPRIPDPAALRPAPDHDRGPGRGRGGDEERRRDPAAGRPQGLSAILRALRLHLGHRDAAGVPGRRGPGDASASSMPRARTTGCCARRRWRSTRSWRGRCWSAGRR